MQVPARAVQRGPAAAAEDLHRPVGRVPGGVRGEQLRLRRQQVGLAAQVRVARVGSRWRPWPRPPAAPARRSPRGPSRSRRCVPAPAGAWRSACRAAGAPWRSASASARQSSITPRQPAATLSRPLTSVPIAMRKPSPSSPSRFCRGHFVVGQLEHAGVGRRHAHLGRQVLALRSPGRPQIDDERADPAACRPWDSRSRRRVGDAAVGDQVLHAVEHDTGRRCCS